MTTVPHSLASARRLPSGPKQRFHPVGVVVGIGRANEVDSVFSAAGGSERGLPPDGHGDYLCPINR